jgi:hypothetical protein
MFFSFFGENAYLPSVPLPTPGEWQKEIATAEFLSYPLLLRQPADMRVREKVPRV